MNDFIIDLLISIRNKKQFHNVIISPYSLQLAMSFLLQAATGKMKAKLKELLLDANQDEDQFLAKLQTQKELLNTICLNSDIRNELSLCRQLQINNDFIQKTEKLLNLQLSQLPTEYENDAFVLTNHLAIKAEWQEGFEEHPFQTDFFYREHGERIEDVFMVSSELRYESEVEYLYQEDFHAVRIWFQEKDSCMEIYLPHQYDGLMALSKQMTYDNLEKWNNAFKAAPYIQLMIPKFEIDASFDLQDFKDQLNLTKLFENTYDYHSIFKEKPEWPIFLKKITQKSKIKVNEIGVEATAETLIGGGSGCNAVVDYSSVIQFDATHPFIFLIKDSKVHTPLFLGTYSGPKSGQKAYIERQRESYYQDFLQNLNQFSINEGMILKINFLKEAMIRENVAIDFIDELLLLFVKQVEVMEQFLRDKNAGKLSSTDQQKFESKWKVFHNQMNELFYVRESSYHLPVVHSSHNPLRNQPRKWTFKQVKELADLNKKETLSTYGLLMSIIYSFVSIADSTIYDCWTANEVNGFYILEMLAKRDQLQVSPSTIQEVEKRSTLDWSKVSTFLSKLTKPEYKQEYEIEQLEIQKRLAYKKVRRFEGFSGRLTFRARNAVVALLIKELANTIKIPTVFLNYVLDLIWKTVFTEIISEDDLEKPYALKSLYCYGQTPEKIPNTIFKTWEEFANSKEKEAHLFSEIYAGIHLEPDDELFGPSSLNQALMSLIKSNIPIPDLSIFEQYLIVDNHYWGPALSNDIILKKNA